MVELPAAESEDSLPRVMLIGSWVTGIDEGMSFAPPLGLYRLKKYLETNRIAMVDVVDVPVLEYPERDLKELLHLTRYDVIGFHPTHVNMEKDLGLIWQVHEWIEEKDSPKPLLVAGGQSVTLDPARWMELAPLDCLVEGFGELVMGNIVQNATRILEVGTGEALAGVSGILYRASNGIQETAPSVYPDEHWFRELSTRYDPSDIIPYEHYWVFMSVLLDEKVNGTAGQKKMMARVFTSSHCPGGCGFCSSQYFHSHAAKRNHLSVWSISAEEMIDLLVKNIEQHGASGLFFNDDNVLLGNAAGRERMMRFCQLVLEKQSQAELPEDLIFAAQTRVKDITVKAGHQCAADTELLGFMGKAGFIFLGLGVESFSDELLYAPSLNRRVTGERNMTAVRGVLNHGIHTVVNIILIPPEATEENVLFNVDVALELMEEGIMVNIEPFIGYYPGAPMTEDASYAYTTKKVEVPGRENAVEIPADFLSKDARLIFLGEELRPEAKRVLEEMKNDPYWNFTYTPKEVVSNSHLVAILRLLGYPAAAKRVAQRTWRFILSKQDGTSQETGWEERFVHRLLFALYHQEDQETSQVRIRLDGADISITAPGIKEVLPFRPPPALHAYMIRNGVSGFNVSLDPAHMENGHVRQIVDTFVEVLVKGDVVGLLGMTGSDEGVLFEECTETARPVQGNRDLQLAFIDLEGTLVDNVGSVSRASFSLVYWMIMKEDMDIRLDRLKAGELAEAGAFFDACICERNLRAGLADVVEAAQRSGKATGTVDEYYDIYRKIQERMFEGVMESQTGNITVFGALAFLDFLMKNNVHTIVNSAAPEVAVRRLMSTSRADEYVGAVLKNEGWQDKLRKIGTESERAGLTLRQCVLLDDDPKIVAAAREDYGDDILIIGVAYNEVLKDALSAAGADIVVDNLSPYGLGRRLTRPEASVNVSGEIDVPREIGPLLDSGTDFLEEAEAVLFPSIPQPRREELERCWKDMKARRAGAPTFKDEAERIVFEQIRAARAFETYQQGYEECKTRYEKNIGRYRYALDRHVLLTPEEREETRRRLLEAKRALQKSMARLMLFNHLHARRKYMHEKTADGTRLVEDTESGRFSLSNNAVFHILENIGIRRHDIVYDPFAGPGNHLFYLMLEHPRRIIAADIAYELPTTAGDHTYAMGENHREVLALFDSLPHFMRPILEEPVFLAADARHPPLKKGTVDRIITDPSYGRNSASDGFAAFTAFMESVPEQFRVLKDGGEAAILVPYEWAVFLGKLMQTRQSREITAFEAHQLFAEILNTSAFYQRKRLAYGDVLDKVAWNRILKTIASYLYLATEETEGKDGLILIYQKIEPVSFYPLALLKLVKTMREDKRQSGRPKQDSKIRAAVSRNDPLISTKRIGGRMWCHDRTSGDFYTLSSKNIERKGGQTAESHAEDLKSRRAFLEHLVGRPFDSFAVLTRQHIPINACTPSTSILYNPWRVMHFLGMTDAEFNDYIRRHPPIVIRLGGRFWISEGRHRLTALQLRGQAHMTAMLIGFTDGDASRIVGDVFEKELPQRTLMGEGELAEGFMRWLRRTAEKTGEAAQAVHLDEL